MLDYFIKRVKVNMDVSVIEPKIRYSINIIDFERIV